jgi:NADPH:quinone reductase-like Zn-dependent oxidoreductase
MQAASVNGIDVYVAAGYVWDAMAHRFPVVLGRDFAGTVEAVGDGVTVVALGDVVTGVITGSELYVGAIAEQVVVDAGIVVRVPEGVSPEEAAALGLAGLTARALVDPLDLTSDDVVLVSGATGGVGSLALQMAAATGATVLATARPGDEDFVDDLGAAFAVDYTGDLPTAVRSLAPDGLTAVVHTAGDTAELGALLRRGGRLTSALGVTADQVGRDDVTVFAVAGTYSPEAMRALLDAVGAGKLKVPIAQSIPLEQAVDALAAFGDHKLGKIVVVR